MSQAVIKTVKLAKVTHLLSEVSHFFNQGNAFLNGESLVLCKLCHPLGAGAEVYSYNQHH